MGVSDFCDSVVVGWRGMLDGDGQEVPYCHIERRETEQVYRGLEQSMAVAFFDLYEAHQRQAAEKKLRGAVRHYLGIDRADRHVVDDELSQAANALKVDLDRLIPSRSRGQGYGL